MGKQEFLEAIVKVCKDHRLSWGLGGVLGIPKLEGGIEPVTAMDVKIAIQAEAFMSVRVRPVPPTTNDAVTVTISGSVGKTTVMGVIGRALAAQGLDVRCYEEGGPREIAPDEITVPAQWAYNPVNVHTVQEAPEPSPPGPGTMGYTDPNAPKYHPSLIKQLPTEADLEAWRTSRVPPDLVPKSKKTFAERVAKELAYARECHPGKQNSFHEGFAVLWEEVDEVWDIVKLRTSKRDLKQMRDELVQVAAMAQRMAEDAGIV